MKLWQALLILALILGEYAHAERVQPYGFSIRPFDLSPKARIRPCLADVFDAGLNVVLVGRSGTCDARIAGPCTYFDANYGPHKGSALVVDHECWAKQFYIAVVGADRSAVHLASPVTGKFSVPPDTERKARQLLLESLAKAHRDAPGYRSSTLKILSAPPKSIKAGAATLLLFQYTEEVQKSTQRSVAPVLIINNSILPLPDTAQHLSFIVDGNLYLTCNWSFGQMSRTVQEVIDLSAGSPRGAYDARQSWSESNRANK